LGYADEARHQAPKKDAATCEKRRGVGSKR